MDIAASVWIRNAILNPDRTLKAVLGIPDILVRIRIRGSVPLTNGSGFPTQVFSEEDEWL